MGKSLKLGSEGKAREALVACQKVQMTFFVSYSSPHGWKYQILTYGMGSRMMERASWAKKKIEL